jgi:putative DNA primase/helicase
MMPKPNPKNEVLLAHEISIATGKSRFELKWRNRTMTVADFLDRLQNFTKTQETIAEFHAMAKAQQDEIKDQGGYVGGLLKGGRRSSNSVAHRSIVTLDMDHAGKIKTDDILDKARDAWAGMAWVCHCTHKHKDTAPRLRFILFLDRPAFPDEYEAVSRKLAAKIGIELFDDSTYQHHRLMYWPSIPRDLSYLYVDYTRDYDNNDLGFVPVDDVLSEYGEDGAWKDTSLWPLSQRQAGILKKHIEKQADPLSKKGLIGAFCRVYHPIDKAIEEFLPDVYRHEGGNRWTLVEGTSSKGLVVYEGGKFAYSNHATDPAANQLCNAFDLVRLHKFGELDADARPETPTHKLPSFVAMEEWASDLKAVKIEIIKAVTDKFETVEEGGAQEVGEDPDAWMEKLHVNKNGIKSIYYNIALILENDVQWRGKIWKNLFTTFKEKGKGGEMWRDEDTLAVRKELAEKYELDVSGVVATDAIDNVASLNTHHPVREYLLGLKWDGVKRIETLWIDYLGEEDNAYTRETALSWTQGTVRRALIPGYKYDWVPVLEGDQGVMKSTMIQILAKNPDWFGELNTVDGQKAVEAMKGRWIMELGEMELSNRHELEQIKAFISATETTVRLSYRREPGTYKRQCTFIGTTNQKEYLKDSTGNRRWWPLIVSTQYRQGGESINIKKLAENVDQIWAEAVHNFYDPDSTVLLSKEALKIAMQRQQDKMPLDEWRGIIGSFLNSPADVNRYEHAYNSTAGQFESNNTEPRDRVCVIEIWQDCLGMKGKPRKFDTNRIAGILDAFPDWERATTSRFGMRYGTQKRWISKAPY